LIPRDAGEAMLTLEPPDTFSLSAALGWLGLGNPAEALAELDGVSAGNRMHPAVLEVRWAVYAEMKRWDLALATAEDLIGVLPGKVDGWLHRAYALRRAPGGGLSQAWEALLPVAEKFPKQPLVAFNLACYACQMQRPDDAREWLRRAKRIEGGKEIVQMALADSDLEPLWPEIRADADK
jgi:tetratricopeptide (TPR) repeat protein